MRARGFGAAPIDPAIEAIELDDWRARNRLASVRINGRVFSARAGHDAPDLTRAIAQERPDGLLVAINSWGSLMAAEAWGGPWATFCPYPWRCPPRRRRRSASAYRPPEGGSVAPGIGSGGRW